MWRTTWPSLLLGLLSINVLVGAHPKEWLIMDAAAVVGLAVAMFGGQWMAAEATNVAAAFALGATSSALCLTIRTQPVSYNFAGIIILVPGSIGVRGSTSLFSASAQPAPAAAGSSGGGSNFAVDMVSVSIELTIGLLLSRAIFPESFVGGSGPSFYERLFMRVRPDDGASRRRWGLRRADSSNQSSATISTIVAQPVGESHALASDSSTADSEGVYVHVAADPSIPGRVIPEVVRDASGDTTVAVQLEPAPVERRH